MINTTCLQICWFLTPKIYCRLSYLLYFTQPKRRLGLVDLTVANDTLYDTETSSAKLFAHGKHVCNCNILHRHGWHRPPKMITTFQKRCILGIGIRNSTFLHLYVRPYNSYYHCEEICICRIELWLNVIIEGRTIPSCTKPTYLDV